MIEDARGCKRMLEDFIGWFAPWAQSTLELEEGMFWLFLCCWFKFLVKLFCRFGFCFYICSAKPSFTSSLGRESPFWVSLGLFGFFLLLF